MAAIRKHFDPYLDLRAIGIFRILLFGVLIVDLLVNKWPSIVPFYTEEGLFSNEMVQRIVEVNPDRWIYNWTLLRWFETKNGVGFFFILTLISYVLTLIGYRTRGFSVLSFIALWSIHMRNSLALAGPDEILINLLFISMFLPLNQRLTMFRPGAKEKENKWRKFPAFYALFFIGMVYFYEAFLKSGDLWQNGEAIYYALMEDLWSKPLADVLMANSELCNFLTASTIWIEYAIPILIFLPVFNKWSRTIAAVLLLCLHWSIYLVLDLGLFPWIVLTYATLLISTESIDAISKRVKRFLPYVKAIELKPKLTKHKTYQGKLATGFMAIFLIVVVWKSALWSDTFNSRLPNPKVMSEINHAPLFVQNWGFYGPNPNITHGWFKVVGVMVNGSMVDLRSGKQATFDDSGIDAYRGDYPWCVFFYRTVMYGHLNSREVFDAWARYEFEEHSKSNRLLKQVQIIAFTKTITAIQEESEVQQFVFSYAPMNR